jgi:CRP/FNR family cyclic AMP-dependent transcriptional regulator
MPTETFQGKKSILLLKQIPLFSGLPDDKLEQLMSMAVLRKVPRNKTIVYAGERTESMFILVNGRATVLNRDSDGNEVILTFLQSGECIGEMGLIDGLPRSADVVSSEPCELLEIFQNDLAKVMEKNVDLCLNIMKSLVARLRNANRKIESLVLMDVYGRVARLLLDLAENEDGVKIIKRRITKQDISKMIGASREMVSRVMKDLEKTGHIRIEKNKIVLTPVPRND